MSRTLGPWKFEESHSTTVHGSHCVGFVVNGKTNVADVCASYDISDDEAMANARLIAAAPALLDALQALLPMVQEWHDEFPRDIGDKEAPAIEAARAAIANATSADKRESQT